MKAKTIQTRWGRTSRSARAQERIRIHRITPAQLRQAAAAALVGLIGAEHLAFGGNRADLSLVFSLLHALLLVGVLATREGREDVATIRGFWPLAGLLLLTLAGEAAAVTPWSAGTLTGGGVAVYPLGVALEMIRLADLAVVFLTAAIIAARIDPAVFLMKGFVWGSIAFSLICLGLHASSPTDVLGWPKPDIARFRLSGVFSSANTAATVFAVQAVLASGALLRTIGKIEGFAFTDKSIQLLEGASVEIIAFFLSLACLMLTGSRGGIVSFAVVYIGLVVWRLRTCPHNRSLLIAFLGLGLTVAAAIGGALAVLHFAHAPVTQDYRIEWMKVAWRLFLSAPLQGYGVGSLAVMYQHLVTGSNFDALASAGAAHNVYLQWLAEGGLLASIPMATLLASTLFRAARHIPKHGPASVWRPTLLAAIALIFIHSLVEYSLQEPSIAALLAVLLGASCSFNARGRRRADPRPRSGPARRRTRR